MNRVGRAEVAILRAAAGFRSATEAARAVRCSRIHMYNIERGSSRPGFKLQARMARAYGIDIEVLRAALKAVQRDLLDRMTEAL